MSKYKFWNDILKETFNIGVGKAASMLSELINKKILLDVPSIDILNSKNKKLDLDKYFSKELSGTLMVSSITFERNIRGEANLIFPADKMRRFINLCMKQEDESSSYDMDFTDIDFDVIKEVGNIILNSIMGVIGNFFNVSMDYSLPRVKLFNKKDFNENIENKKDICILMLYITFIVDDTEIEGAVIIDLTLNSLNELSKIMRKMEDELYG